MSGFWLGFLVGVCVTLVVCVVAYEADRRRA